ncbi:glucagon-like [Solea senegalensis]|uniref:Glucagon-like n=1 Tax=Solea senegalensis TaxID=28829 RepID=A0AAV6SQI9_SOLSE|nr:glucagon-like [Solea senegalensis]
MSVLMWCMLILLLCPHSEEMVVIKTRPESSAFLRWRTYRLEKGQNIIQTLKRHADGTFTSDFTHYLDKIKAKDFVDWLARKKEGCEEDLHHTAEV